AVMEASASGVPVVASDAGGTREIVEEGVTGFLVPPQAPEQIALKVLALLGSPDRAADMGRRGAQRMREQFSLATCVNRHREIYLSAIRQADARSSRGEPG
ncbi:MAG TPA: glycosyltransferase, partial [Candidatus Binataceae bacterium]|nr:glycosyltransferase [Candidatus Binataceae bacterium]